MGSWERSPPRPGSAWRRRRERGRDHPALHAAVDHDSASAMLAAAPESANTTAVAVSPGSTKRPVVTSSASGACSKKGRDVHPGTRGELACKVVENRP